MFNQLTKKLTISLAATLLVLSGATMASASKVNVMMKDNGYHVQTGDQAGGGGDSFSMNAGEVNEITLTNSDTTAHEFVSKAFNSMDVTVSGKAVSVKDGLATGYRVEPGKTIVLKVTPKVGADFSGSYDVFYCPIHGKANMKGEVIVADSRTGTGAF